MSFPQTIVGKWGWEQQTSTTQKQKLGTKMQIEDTLYVYGKAGEAIIEAGDMFLPEFLTDAVETITNNEIKKYFLNKLENKIHEH